MLNVTVVLAVAAGVSSSVTVSLNSIDCPYRAANVGVGTVNVVVAAVGVANDNHEYASVTTSHFWLSRAPPSGSKLPLVNVAVAGVVDVAAVVTATDAIATGGLSLRCAKDEGAQTSTPANNATNANSASENLRRPAAPPPPDQTE